MLETNIRNVLRPIDGRVGVTNHWDKLVVATPNQNPLQIKKLIHCLSRIPGIVHFLEVNESSFTDLDDIYQQVLAAYKDKLSGKKFAVRAKRSGQHSFTSTEVERYVGGGLSQFTDAAGVRLKNPDIEVKIEIEDQKLFIVSKKHQGLGGFPIATREDVLSLISGGFDSGVASFQMIRKGCRTHYCFFNLGGREHEIGVKQVSYYLWKEFSASHRVKFISVDFAPVVEQILERVENGQMGVVLKRLMMRAAAIVAQKLAIKSLVTGEALGQVSSQTLTNLNVIDRATDTLILRPLICMDKQEIIDQARAIGTEDFAKTMPEYCGVISKKPTVKAVLAKIEAEEQKIDLSLLDELVAQSDFVDIRDIAVQTDQEVDAVESVSLLTPGDIVLDIRSPYEEQDNPLDLADIEIKHIPFYKLASQFADLDQSRNYYLYCNRGIMSKMQALLLHEHGFNNAKVYRP